jgi:asparagine synthase (glutamine-hydrolysing)
MCGIAGKLNLDGRTVEPGLIRRMTDVMSHRGPDGEGQHVSGPIGLGHRRLAIIDLRPTGAQPMCNEDGRVWITFNGEIYNYQALRRDLLQRGHQFRSESDTEVIVHLWEEYGPECVAHLRGMFAFGIWDDGRKTLFVARDRVGIKPLYYCETGTSIVFASEIKALLLDPDVKREIDPAAIDRFLTYYYLPGAGTMLKDVAKLEPGHYLLVRDSRTTRKQYWDLQYGGQHGYRSMDEAAEALGSLLRSTVADHMISDVPVGFLASGGVDSTALLSYAVDETDKPIQTFTVGFSGENVVDERPYARLASEQFRTIHREITVSAEDFRTFLPGYVWHMEEPVCEPPAIALYYVSKLAREHVKVLLSGEGGDEAFGGYPEYRNYTAFERWKKRAGPLVGAGHAALTLASRFGSLQRLDKYAAFIDRRPEDYFYSRTSSPYNYFNRYKPVLYTDAFAKTLSGTRSADITRRLFDRSGSRNFLEQMLYVDTKTWLPDDLLIKADKITMATSLELRVPFLDHQVLEFAASLPPSFKVKGRETKRVLRRAFSGQVPEAVLSRKKAGFPVPYGRWLTHDLREFVADTLLSRRALSRGYFNRSQVETILQPSTAASDRERFSLLVLELWCRQFVD